MPASTEYDPKAVAPGMWVVTGEDEPWQAHSSGVRTERVLWVGRLRVRTDRETYWRGGRQTRLQPLPHPRRILARLLAD